MNTILVTGGAGFIGSGFIRYMLSAHEDIRIVNFDALTYAGNLENLRAIEADPRYRFVRGDICDAAAVTEALCAHERARYANGTRSVPSRRKHPISSHLHRRSVR